MRSRKRSHKYNEDSDSDLDEFLEPIKFSSPGGRKKEETAVVEDGPPLVVEKILGRKFMRDAGEASGCNEMYLVKWRGKSYIHVSWEAKVDIERVDPQGKMKIKRFLQSPLPPLIFGDPSKAEGSGSEGGDGSEEEDIEYFNSDYAEIHRIISCDSPGCSHADCSTVAEMESIADCLDDTDDSIFYFVKWRGLPYNECSWERWGDIKYYSHEVFAFWQRQHAPPLASLSVQHPSLQDYTRLAKSPVYGISTSTSSVAASDRGGGSGEEEDEDMAVAGAGLTMRDYQLEGVNWLLWNWWHKRPCILADEMGLGKTIQSVCFLQQLRTMSTTQCSGPFLVVAPLSLIAQWQSEIALWSPDMNCVVMHGSQQAREIILSYEFYHHESFTPKTDVVALRKKNACKFDILLTTYEICMKDIKIFTKINWKVLIVDEAHRLKNHQSRLFEVMMTIPRQQCVLLTGTPLQNKTEELWSLLHFADPSKFKNQFEFVRHFGDLRDAKDVANLHLVLKPYLLRRVKEDVEKTLPPKEEVIIEVALTPFQKQFYRAIYEKNVQFLFRGAKASNTPSLMNVMMELRKCCNHPYLIRGVEDRLVAEMAPEDQTDASLHQKLVDCSGKLVLLDKLLPRLKDEGRKVLIFSQMVKVLNLLEDYLRFKHYLFERLDGSSRSTDRNMAVERFCRPSLKRFVMLLSTKAGGLGLNLTSADTVIIFDSDWNPHNDMQAQARAHRIGQTKAVKVYRLLTRKTYEMHMFHKASMKLGLDKAVLAHARNEQEAEDSKVNEPNKLNLQAKEIDELLKRGAYDIFRDDDTEQTEFIEADIDSILDRQAHVVSVDHAGENSLLGGFSKASFVSADETEDIDINDADFWKKAVGFEEPVQEEEVDPFIENLPNQRKRKQTQSYGDNDVDERELEDLLRLQPIKKSPVKEVKKEKEVPSTIVKKKKDKPVREPKEPKEHKDPKAWGPHARDRMLRALLQFGFGRWKKIRTESGATHRELRDIEGFSRSYMLQCGLCAGIGSGSEKEESAKEKTRGGGHPSSDFIDDAVNAAAQISELVKKGEVEMSSLIPPILQETKFVGKLKGGGSRKMLNKLDQLTRLFGLVGKAVEVYCETKKNDIDRNGDLDYIVGQINDSKGLAECIPLGDFRPSWSRPRSWWDEECDQQLILGVFEHGHAKYPEIRDDGHFVFHDRLKLAAEHAMATVKADSKGYPVISKLVNRVLGMTTISKNKCKDVLSDDVITTVLTLSPGKKCRVLIATVRHSTYRGVYSQPGSTKWMSQYGSNAKSSFIGSFDTEKEAAVAYDGLAKKLEGNEAGCNFICVSESPLPNSETSISDNHADCSNSATSSLPSSASPLREEEAEAKEPTRVRQAHITPFARDESPPLPWHRASRYRGVRASGAKWTAQICYDGINHHLGTFSGEYQAALSYDLSALKHHGEVAVLNFPEVGGIEAELESLEGVEGVEVYYFDADTTSLEGEESQDNEVGNSADGKSTDATASGKSSGENGVESIAEVQSSMGTETGKKVGYVVKEGEGDADTAEQMSVSAPADTVGASADSIDMEVDLEVDDPVREGREGRSESVIKTESVFDLPSTSSEGKGDENGSRDSHSLPGSATADVSSVVAIKKEDMQEVVVGDGRGERIGTKSEDTTEKEKIVVVDNEVEEDIDEDDVGADADADDDDDNDGKEKKAKKDAGGPLPPSLLTPEEEKLRSDMLMPESRVLNRLFAWLISDEARLSQTEMDEQNADATGAPSSERDAGEVKSKQQGTKRARRTSRGGSSFSGDADGDKEDGEDSSSVLDETGGTVVTRSGRRHPTLTAARSMSGRRSGGIGSRGGVSRIPAPVTLDEKDMLTMHHDIFGHDSFNFPQKNFMILECRDLLNSSSAQTSCGGAEGGTTAVTVDHIVASTSPVADDASVITADQGKCLCAAFILMGAPFNDDKNSIYCADVSALLGTEESELRSPSVELGARIASENSCNDSDNLANRRLEAFQWDNFMRHAGVTSPPAHSVQAYYENTWLPFCVKISSLIFFTNENGLPDPSSEMSSHSLATKGLCSLFMQRQRMLHSMRYILSTYPTGLRTFLRQHAGNYTIGMPVWWCPWIHDIALMVGCLKHGFMNVKEIISDKESPFWWQHLERHIYRVFVYGCASHAPAAAGVFSCIEEAKQWVEQVALVFPSHDALESRMTQLLAELTKHLSSKHLYRINYHPEMPGVAISTSNLLQPPNSATDDAKNMSSFDPINGLTEWSIRLPLAPLTTHTQGSSKRRRLSLMDILRRPAPAPFLAPPKKKYRRRSSDKFSSSGGGDGGNDISGAVGR